MTKRRDELKEFGETRARRLLQQKGFEVERMPKNFPFWGLMAKRGSCRLLVPVKTRNNTTSQGGTKKHAYNLYPKEGHYEAAQKIAAFAGAKIHWITVTVNAKAKTFSACMGDVAELSSPKRIPMHPKLHLPNYKRLATDQPDDEILEAWSNVVGSERGRHSPSVSAGFGKSSRDPHWRHSQRLRLPIATMTSHFL